MKSTYIKGILFRSMEDAYYLRPAGDPEGIALDAKRLRHLDQLAHLASISCVPFFSPGDWYLFCDTRLPQIQYWRVCVY